MSDTDTETSPALSILSGCLLFSVLLLHHPSLRAFFQQKIASQYGSFSFLFFFVLAVGKNVSQVCNSSISKTVDILFISFAMN